MDVFTRYAEAYDVTKVEEMLLQDYLLGCRDDATMRATTAERMVAAIGEPELVDTSHDQRLGRIFLNRTIKRYRAFADLYGTEETVERVVGFFRHASQGLEERKQILYLLGPVGGGKSTLAEILKQLIEKQPVYVLKAGEQISPVFESPLGLFDRPRFGDLLEDKYNIPRRLLTGLMSPWAVKRLQEFGGDISKFSVVKLYPSRLRQICVAKTEPGDENNQDVSSLVGKLDIRKLEHLSQNDPDAYSYSGGLNRTTQGVLEFVEMFKAPIKVLHPLLTATQEGSYIGTENIGALPYQGIIIAHSNESEWQQFKSNKNNEAFLDRISVIKVPYCLRATEESQIYGKLLSESTLREAPCAPETLPILARFSVLTRLREHENSTLYSKLRTYDGETLKHTDPKAKSMQEYRDAAGVDEGMTGVSTRFAFKILSETFNHDNEEVGADPVHLMYVLEQAVRREQFSDEIESRYLEFIKTELARRYAEFIGEEIQKAYLEFLLGLWPEPLRPLHRLCRRLDRGAGLQGSGHRPDVRPRDSGAGARQDREAGRRLELQGLPQRGGQVRAAGTRRERRQEPRLAQVRKAAPGDREADVRTGRGTAAGHQLRGEARQGDRRQARQLRRTHDRARIHAPAGAAAGGVVHARQQGGVSGQAPWLISSTAA